MIAVEHKAYLKWNERIARFWFTKGTSDAPVYLAVTPRALASAIFELEGTVVEPEASERDLIDAVRAFYAQWVIKDGNDLCGLAHSAAEYPDCLAFLAFSVLAARHMRADDRNRSTAYYARLAELLQCSLIHDLPAGFSKESFESLWMHARDWSIASAVRPLVLPTTDDVYRRYIAYPMGHVGLRQVDLDRLPDFFEWAGYSAGASVALDRIRADLTRWIAGDNRLTRQGTAACCDERNNVVVQEVAQELATWGGAAEDQAGRRVARVELVLELVRGLPRFSYLPRRPPGFPELFEHGEHGFESLQHGWYIPIPVPLDDGTALLHGFEWVSANTTPPYVLRRNRASAIAFVESEEYAGLTSRNRLLAGVTCAVIYHTTVAPRVEAHIARVASSTPKRIERAPGLPSGWRCLLDVRFEKPSSEADPELPALDVDAAVELMTTGGLRLGRRASWLRTVPPRVLVSGGIDLVRIDGREVRVADGVVQWDTRRLAAGVHVIEADRSQLRVELVDSLLSDGLALLVSGHLGDPHVVGLQKGQWTILGEHEGDVHEVELHNDELVCSPFEPVWAVRTSPQECVLFLPPSGRRPAGVRDDSVADGRWAETIRIAADNEVPLVCLTPAASEDAWASWTRFVRAAQAPARRTQGNPS